MKKLAWLLLISASSSFAGEKILVKHETLMYPGGSIDSYTNPWQILWKIKQEKLCADSGVKSIDNFKIEVKNATFVIEGENITAQSYPTVSSSAEIECN